MPRVPRVPPLAPAIAGLLFLAIAFGYATGRTVAVQTAVHNSPAQVQDEPLQPSVPTVRIHGIRNGKVEGSLLAGSRLVIGNQPIVAQDDTTFSMDAERLLTNIITVEVPPGMHYVASRRGSKYYPVGSSGGERLSVRNRIYFPTAAEAEAAGYEE